MKLLFLGCILLTPFSVFAAGDPHIDPAAFSQCLQTLRPAALSRGITTEIYDSYTQDLTPDATVLRLLDSQPEFRTPIWDYLAGLIDDPRVEDGRSMLKAHNETLSAISAKYGVDPSVIVSIWGVETDYGRVFGQRPIRASLATLSCFGRRQTFFRNEFIELLKLLQAGDIQDVDLKGSWAGAFGHTQFMPSVYGRIAVDEDGDGHRNLVRSIPDALASTANYLKQSGWQTGKPWGFEIRLPANFDEKLAGRKNRKNLAQWRTMGIRKADGTPLPQGNEQAAVLLPAGAKGPAFMIFRNFDVIHAYNPAESYALAIALLSDRLKGNGELAATWPTDDPGLGRNERKELQTLLFSRGHDIGEADGIIGSKTRRAILTEEQRLGWKNTEGRAGRKILDTLLRETEEHKNPLSPPAASERKDQKPE